MSEMIEDFQDYLGLGIAGNFTNHLKQANEEDDFVDIITDEKDAPKGLFPFYVPNDKTFLGEFPLSGDTVLYPKDKSLNIQMEPELALVCDLTYKDDKVDTVSPISFYAYNDCSIRRKNATKISQKKNWGASSKGISPCCIDIDNFDKNGVLEKYKIVSYIKRDGKLYQYGKDSFVSNYSYNYTKLLNWTKEKLNNQVDEGPLENINKLILSMSSKPKKLLISIGATEYTDFGETTFLDIDDDTFVCIYDFTKYDLRDIENSLEDNTYDKLKMCSILHQKVK